MREALQSLAGRVVMRRSDGDLRRRRARTYRDSEARAAALLHEWIEVKGDASRLAAALPLLRRIGALLPYHLDGVDATAWMKLALFQRTREADPALKAAITQLLAAARERIASSAVPARLAGRDLAVPREEERWIRATYTALGNFFKDSNNLLTSTESRAAPLERLNTLLDKLATEFSPKNRRRETPRRLGVDDLTYRYRDGNLTTLTAPRLLAAIATGRAHNISPSQVQKLSSRAGRAAKN